MFITKSSIRKFAGAGTGAALVAVILFALYCGGDGTPDYCGDGHPLNSTTQFCHNGETFDKCGGQTYNPDVQFCRYNSLHNLCNGFEFDPAINFCSDNTVLQKCNGEEFTPATEGCVHGNVMLKCGRNFFDEDVEFCFDNRHVFRNCNTPNFDPTTFDPDVGCNGTPTLPTCDGVEYEPTNLFCFYDESENEFDTRELCGGEDFDVNTHECVGDVVQSKTDDNNDDKPNDNPNDSTNTNITRILTINSNPIAGGTVTVNGTTAAATSSHADGAEVEVCASANDGYTFTGWQGASTETRECVTIVMSANRTLTARFESEGSNQAIPPNPPRDLITTGTTRTSVTISWTAPTAVLGANVTGYNVYRRDGSLGTYEFVASTNATTTRYTDSGLQSSTTYFYSVTARNSEAESEMSAWVRATTIASADEIQYGENITDSRDGKIYETVIIGTRVWMARNLDNRELVEYGEGFWCYDNLPANCDIYGGLYTWQTAMDYGCNGFGDDWRLPDTSDWSALERTIERRLGDRAGQHLKAQTGWGEYCVPVLPPDANTRIYYLCEDSFGFAALPGGIYNEVLSNDGFSVGFSSIGNYGAWWTTSEGGRYRNIYSNNDVLQNNWTNGTYRGMSVRCVRDVD